MKNSQSNRKGGVLPKILETLYIIPPSINSIRDPHPRSQTGRATIAIAIDHTKYPSYIQKDHYNGSPNLRLCRCSTRRQMERQTLGRFPRHSQIIERYRRGQTGEHSFPLSPTCKNILLTIIQESRNNNPTTLYCIFNSKSTRGFPMLNTTKGIIPPAYAYEHLPNKGFKYTIDSFEKLMERTIQHLHTKPVGNGIEWSFGLLRCCLRFDMHATNKPPKKERLTLPSSI